MLDNPRIHIVLYSPEPTLIALALLVRTFFLSTILSSLTSVLTAPVLLTVLAAMVVLLWTMPSGSSFSTNTSERAKGAG